jgi:hypothetical protein
LQKLPKSRAGRPGWNTFPPGETMLEAGPRELTILARGSDGINCRFGLD